MEYECIEYLWTGFGRMNAWIRHPWVMALPGFQSMSLCRRIFEIRPWHMVEFGI